ncbi:MAG: hypothetical protein J2O48_01740 [Solirubrobacterales bacterium]|nr:hypothetical protein [Solirubrobacterales bacterium]
MSNDNAPVVHWNRATIEHDHLSGNYTLEIPVMFDCPSAEAGIQHELESDYPGRRWEVASGHIVRDGNGARAELGYVRLTDPQLLNGNVQPTDLRIAVGNAVTQQVALARHNDEQNRGRMDSFLASLR